MRLYQLINLLIPLTILDSINSKIHSKDFKNVNLARTLDVSDPAKIRDHTSLVILNQQNKSANKYYFTLNKKVNSTIASISVQTKAEKIPLGVKIEKYDEENDLQYYSIHLDPPLRSEGKTVLNIRISRINAIEPYPKVSEQREKQLLRIKENLYFSTPYNSDAQKVIVKVPNSAIIGHSSTPLPVEKKDRVIDFGPYKDLKPFPQDELMVHFHHKKPIVYANTIFRDLEVSHWGSNLAVEEHYNVGNFGPGIKGENSNFIHKTLERLQHTERFITHFDLIAPKGASEAYYRDEIGNVSTSNFYSGKKNSKFNLQPRYPIYGGWTYTWYHGYNLPLKDYLKYDSNDPTKFTLRVPFLKPVDNISTLDFTFRVVLPEGASHVNVKPLPFEFAEIEFGRIFTYFDTVGRPTITIKRKNVIHHQWKEIEIEYTYEPFNLLRKPTVVFIALFATFLLISFVGRLNLSLVVEQSKKKTKKDK